MTKEANQRMASTGGDEMAEHWLFCDVHSSSIQM